MHISSVTPFGRRSMTLAMLAHQVAEPEPDARVNRWEIYHLVCDAKEKLALTDRSLALLNALLTFYPADDLSAEAGLIVFPSNAKLSARAHGMAEQTMRRHLAVLIDAGLITRKDSANGKRFRRAGEAFGFSLAPMLARESEIRQLAGEALAERQALKQVREQITICRRDISKLIEVALDEGASGDWQTWSTQLAELTQTLPRRPTLTQARDLLDELTLLREGIVNTLEMQIISANPSGNPPQNERHIQNSNTHSTIEFEQLKKNEQAKTFALPVILKACPEIVAYGPGGQVQSWRDLMQAATVVRSMLGVSPSAYQEACEVLGQENAAATMACILERASQITSAGGYLRTLTARAKRGEFSLGPMVMAQLRAAA